MTMNSAAQVDQFFENWRREGWSKEQLIIKTAEAEMGWPYVWGAVGAQCTPEKRTYYMNRSAIGEKDREMIKKRCPVLSNQQSACHGCEYYPGDARTLIDDCQGFVKQVMSRVSISFTGGGCTSMWNNAGNWSEKGKLENMPLDRVCCVFIANGDKMDHIGIHIGQGVVIHCSIYVRKGKVPDKAWGWSHYAIPKGLGGDTPMPQHKTLRKGDSGPDVVECQEDLLKLGYDLSPYGADGKYGNTTIREVKKFQKAMGLSADGICGPKTWEALDAAVGPSPTPVTKLFTVHIPHLTEYQADGLIATYAGSWKTEE